MGLGFHHTLEGVRCFPVTVILFVHFRILCSICGDYKLFVIPNATIRHMTSGCCVGIRGTDPITKGGCVRQTHIGHGCHFILATTGLENAVH